MFIGIVKDIVNSGTIITLEVQEDDETLHFIHMDSTPFRHMYDAEAGIILDRPISYDGETIEFLDS